MDGTQAAQGVWVVIHSRITPNVLTPSQATTLLVVKKIVPTLCVVMLVGLPRSVRLTYHVNVTG